MVRSSRVLRFCFLILATALLVAGSRPSLSKPCAERVALVVDAYSSGIDLISAFRTRGVRVIHVHAHPEMTAEPAFWRSFHESGVKSLLIQDFVIDSRKPEQVQRLLAELKHRSIFAVVAGAETGVLLADQLGEGLGVPNNGTALSLARIDKFEMHRVLREKGLAHIDQMKSKDYRELEAWVLEHGRWPVVVKPPSSAGTNGVYFVHSIEEFSAAFNKIFAKLNGLNQINEAVIVQEFVEGTEFSVNTVSLDGRHIVTEILDYERTRVEGAATLYRANRLQNPISGDPLFEGLSDRRERSGLFLDSLGKVSRVDDLNREVEKRRMLQQSLVSYSKQVLDALGIQHGPAHIELMRRPDGQIVLVEVGARICGAQTPRMIRAATDSCQVLTTVEAALDPESFRARAPMYSVRQQALQYFVHTQTPGSRLNFETIEAARRLPGVIAVYPHFQEGEALPRSIDADTIPLDIQIVGNSTTLYWTREKIESWEREGRFEIVEPE